MALPQSHHGSSVTMIHLSVQNIVCTKYRQWQCLVLQLVMQLQWAAPINLCTIDQALDQSQ